MFRSFFIYLSKAVWARQVVTNWRVSWKMASRFIAGKQVSDAIRAIRALNEKGINATLDHLGEHTTNPESAVQATQDILEALEAIHQSGLCANVSIKLTQIGMVVDQKLCVSNLEKILTSARELNNFIRVDMEDSPVTQRTLDIVQQMRQAGYDNLGVVIQAYLYRSESDIRQLCEEGITVRLCKGAYKEPPDVAFPKKQDVDRNYDRLAELLMEAAKKRGSPVLSENGCYPPIPILATHDERRITHALNYAQQIDLPKRAIEFQMLFGIRRDLQESLALQGYPVRVYVPYGTEWYPYYMRRLAERPANIWFFISNLLR